MDEMDMDLTPWLKGFVKSVGKDRAKMLLNGTGVFEVKTLWFVGTNKHWLVDDFENITTS